MCSRRNGEIPDRCRRGVAKLDREQRRQVPPDQDVRVQVHDAPDLLRDWKTTHRRIYWGLLDGDVWHRPTRRLHPKTEQHGSGSEERQPLPARSGSHSTRVHLETEENRNPADRGKAALGALRSRTVIHDMEYG